MKIDLQVNDGKTDKTLERLEKILERLDASQEKLNASLKGTATDAGAAASAYNRLANSAGRAASATARVKAPPIVDAAQAKAAAAARLAVDPFDKNALLMHNQAQRKLNAADPNKQYLSAMMRTRFAQTAGGKTMAMPLGVDLMKFGPALFGDGAGAAGATGMAPAVSAAVLLPVAAAGVAIATFVAMLNRASQSLRAIASDLSHGGGNVSMYGGLTAASGFLGSSPGALAAQLQGGIEGGLGAAYASSIGINPMGGPFGDIDYATKLQKVMRDIANSKTFSEARRKAMMAGMPELAQLQLLSPGNKAAIGGAFGVNDKAVRTAANYEFAITRVNKAMERIASIAVAPALESFAAWMEMVANLADKAGKKLEENEPAIKKVWDAAWGAGEAAASGIPGVGPAVSSGMEAAKRGIEGMANMEKERAKATRENTDALKDNTKGMREGYHGGGPRARGSEPKAFWGNPNLQAMQTSLKLGAI